MLIHVLHKNTCTLSHRTAGDVDHTLCVYIGGQHDFYKVIYSFKPHDYSGNQVMSD